MCRNQLSKCRCNYSRPQRPKADDSVANNISAVAIELRTESYSSINPDIHPSTRSWSVRSFVPSFGCITQRRYTCHNISSNISIRTSRGAVQLATPGRFTNCPIAYPFHIHKTPLIEMH